jgi:hypothetical protein
MWPQAVMEVETLPYGRAGVRHGGVGFQLGLLVFDVLPDPLNEDVVAPGSLAIHAAAGRIIDQSRLPNLRMEGVHVNYWHLRLRPCLGAEQSGSPFQKLIPPLLDLVSVDIELLRQLRQRLLALDRSQPCLALKAGLWFRRVRLGCRHLFTAYPTPLLCR